MGLKAILNVAITVMLASAAVRAESVQIMLRAKAEVTGDLLTLGDIAQLSGGDPARRRRLAALDVAHAGDAAGPLHLTQAQVRLRLQLSDLPPTSWTLGGPRVIQVEFLEDPNPGTPVLDQIRVDYAKWLGLPAAQLKVTLLYPLAPEIRELSSTHLIRPIITSEPRLGRATVRLGIYANGELVGNHTAAVEIQSYVDVPVAIDTIERGTELTGDLVRWERRPLSDPEAVPSAKSFVGKQARQTINAGQAIRHTQLTQTITRKKPTIAARRSVRMIAQRGSLKVVVSNGIALQSGFEGDTIRVKNPNSGEVKLAEVIGPDQVRVSF